jgi:acetyl esterase/lipase
MRLLLLLLVPALATLLGNPCASAAEYKVTMKSAVPYAEHGGVRLVGDLYLPAGRGKAPVVVAFHGGAWRSGSRAFYRYWGPFLARNGYAVFTVDYRLGKPGRYPAAVEDAKAAVEFVRARADEFQIDVERTGSWAIQPEGISRRCWRLRPTALLRHTATMPMPPSRSM